MSQASLIDIAQFKASHTLMVQGCTSDAGKTVMVAGFCRLLAHAGITVAPFKPQNMALNSAVTSNGGEIGRAQALQAIAAGIEPHTDLNPILLKPCSDTGSQVIVHGKAISDMQAAAYHDYKKVAMQAVIDSFHRLDQQYQSIVVEGAGSPAEINLREGDIANMGFAENVDCPVVLVADIDRGGVFAHLVGTLALLSASEQNRVVGFIINRFRGDIKLLQPGIDWLEQRTGKPVLGTIPYLHNLFLDAEDAINYTTNKDQSLTKKTMKVVVPVLPRISNHTDFDALRLHPNIDLSFVPVDAIDRTADLIILPGSKSVIHDLQTLIDNDWQTTLNKHLRYGGKLIGICGGYQMLGETILDPSGVENQGVANSAHGFSLLPINTELADSKQLKNVQATFEHPFFDSTSVTGYEIHCGQSQRLLSQGSLFRLADHSHEGCVSDDNQVLGTYLHGLFDSPQACDQLLKWAGLNEGHAVDIDRIREEQLNRLTDSLKQHCRPDFIEQITNIALAQQTGFNAGTSNQ